MRQKAMKRSAPAKTGINLCMREDHSANIRLLVIGCVMIVLLAGAVAKFGVFDQYARLNAAQAAYNRAQSQSQKLAGLLKDYDRVEADYYIYSRQWLENADTHVDRRLVLDLIEKNLVPMGTIQSITVRDALINVVMAVEALKDFAPLKASLEESEIVAQALLKEARKDEATGLTHITLTILLRQEEAQ